MSDSVFIGIDVSSQTLEVASSAQAKTWQARNDAHGIESLCSQLTALGNRESIRPAPSPPCETCSQESCFCSSVGADTEVNHF